MLTGFESNLTLQQKEALEQLKTLLRKSEYAQDVEEFPDGDRFTLRFLRASMKDKYGDRIFDVNAAEERIKKTLAWRREYEVEDIRKAIERGESKGPEGLEKFDQINPHVDFVNPETGALLRFDRFATMASLLHEDALKERDWIRCMAFTMEKVLHTLRIESAKHGREISSYSTFVDASGVSLSGIISRRKFVQFMSGVGADHYPESLGKTFIMNCPWYFPKIFNLVKPFIDKDTLSKLSVHSNVPLDEILKFAPKSIIPKEHGGDNETTIPQPVYTFD